MTKLADMSLTQSEDEDEACDAFRSESVELKLRMPLCNGCRMKISESALTFTLWPEEVRELLLVIYLGFYLDKRHFVCRFANAKFHTILHFFFGPLV